MVFAHSNLIQFLYAFLIFLYRWKCKDARFVIRDLGDTTNWGNETIISTCTWYSNYTRSPDNLECVLRYCTNPGIFFFFFQYYDSLFYLGVISLSVAEASSTSPASSRPENVLKNDDSIWHSAHKNSDPIPYISFKMEKEEEVFMVNVVDRLGCPACSGRFKDVEVRVALTPSYDGAVSCGIKSGDGIVVTVHK